MNGWIVRPATAEDRPGIAALEGATFEPAGPDDQQALHLVAADISTGQLLASATLRRAIGLQQPRGWYHVGCTVHAAPELRLFHRQRTLLLGNDHTGASELARLAWARIGVPLGEQAAALRGVVQGCLLAMARARQDYAAQLIVELPGLRDSAGQSPFWSGLGRHFYDVDPLDAAARHGPAWRGLVAALLPRHPVMAAFLPEAAQAAIAQVAPKALVLRELLEEAGLRYGHHVTVDDAGPVLEADLDSLPGVTQARQWSAAAATGGDAPGAPCVVLSEGFRALRCQATIQGPRLLLPDAALESLGVTPGEPVWARPL
jgi:arginine N-succinyltransferase